MAAKKSYAMPPPIAHSGPKGLLQGFDARNREIASSTGGTVTAKMLTREGKHVPKAKAEWLTPPDYWMANPIHHSADKRDYPKTKAGKQAKVHKVLHEMKEGTLKSSSGQKVTNRKQGIAIALSEAGLSRK